MPSHIVSVAILNYKDESFLFFCSVFNPKKPVGKIIASEGLSFAICTH